MKCTREYTLYDGSVIAIELDDVGEMTDDSGTAARAVSRSAQVQQEVEDEKSGRIAKDIEKIHQKCLK